jgi:hypothetical protein
MEVPSTWPSNFAPLAHGTFRKSVPTITGVPDFFLGMTSHNYQAGAPKCAALKCCDGSGLPPSATQPGSVVGVLQVGGHGVESSSYSCPVH